MRDEYMYETKCFLYDDIENRQMKICLFSPERHQNRGFDDSEQPRNHTKEKREGKGEREKKDS